MKFQNLMVNKIFLISLEFFINWQKYSVSNCRFRLGFELLVYGGYFNQGTLTEGEGSV